MIMRIESIYNPRIKMIRSLRSAKGRKKEKRFVVEGSKMVEEALRDCPEAVEAVFTTEKVQIAAGIQQILVTESVFSHMSTQTAPQGVLAILNPVRIPHTKRGHTLLLDGVADPGNMGTLLRTAEAFDFSVWITPDCADPLNPKAVQASMGAILRHRPQVLSLQDLQDLAQTHFFAGASLEGDWTPDPWPEQTVLVLGSEAHGIRKEVDALLHTHLRIPMAGQTESLNVGVAGGILMFTAFQRKWGR
ncbi:MAG: TrmH family RNA methyltransferase [Peptoniphilaceae bacterium]|jgi:TrmH family RNA methyltransferase